jgi:formylglycine-generating enzyme required for sulfatase activity
MSNQKNNTIFQIVSTTFPHTGISLQFRLPALFRIKPALAQYFTFGGNKAINGLLILPFLILLITACSKPNNNSEYNFNSSSLGADNGSSSLGADNGNNSSIYSTFDGMEFIIIKPGCFNMGSNDGQDEEKPIHRVCISKPFYLGKTEVTKSQWEAVTDSNHDLFKGDNRPIEQISWTSVQSFIQQLNGKVNGNPYRLPTEAEWEYAARAGSSSIYYFGDVVDPLRQHAWFQNNSDGKTHPVAQKLSNQWGLYDMYGNVWEWVQDWHDKDYYTNSPTNDPQGQSSGSNRVIRGGSWSNDSVRCNSAYRSYYQPNGSSTIIGFRLVRQL